MGLPRWGSGKVSACQAGNTEVSVWSLGQEDLLEYEMAAQSSILYT